jgi:BirA family biotin operon repressor/biotin-[acetyl-CoA-carboxylase] ligase
MPLDADSLRARLPQRDVVWLDSTTSTMTEAAGCRPGTVVVADEQSAGQGRQGRVWYSEKGTGLYVSIVLRPELPPETLPAITLALGLAVREAILRSTGIACGLKWPNDVLAGGRKCAGILAQGTSAAVVAGIGINVNQERFPSELGDSATSLKIVSGRAHSRLELLVHLLEAVDKYAGLLQQEGSERIIGLYSRPPERGDGYVVGVGCRQ